MLRIILGVLAAVLVLNVLFVGWLAFLSFVQRHRAASADTNVRELPRAHALPPLMDRRASRRLVGAVTLAAMLFAGTAFASPRARELAATMIGSVARGLQIGPTEEATRDLSAPIGGQSASAAIREGTTASQAPVRGASPSNQSSTAVHGSGSGEPTVSPPPGPTAVTAASISSSIISIGWTDVGTETGYRVERSDDGSTEWHVVGSTLADMSAYSDDAGLQPGTTYYYRVIATNDAGDSSPSDIASATTSVDPASPTTVTAKVFSSSSIVLNWTDVETETGYRVERSADGVTGWITLTTTGQDITTYEDASLQAGVTYYYRVFATNAGGDSIASDVASATTDVDLPSPAAGAALPSP